MVMAGGVIYLLIHPEPCPLRAAPVRKRILDVFLSTRIFSQYIPSHRYRTEPIGGFTAGYWAWLRWSLGPDRLGHQHP